MNIGVAAASLLMIYAGYLGDFAVTSREFGGLGLTIEAAAEQVLDHFIVPVAALLLLVLVGTIAGGAGFVLNHFKKRYLRLEHYSY